uniref:Uncharacterized protein n=1 Tax=Arion vulgaris TaxID=1028688 RepID=A0A0B7BGG2_9EUPU
MRDKTMQNDRHINILRNQNEELQTQIKALQKSQLSVGKSVLGSSFLTDRDDDDDYESYEETIVPPPSKRKKMKSSKS